MCRKLELVMELFRLTKALPICPHLPCVERRMGGSGSRPLGFRSSGRVHIERARVRSLEGARVQDVTRELAVDAGDGGVRVRLVAAAQEAVVWAHAHSVVRVTVADARPVHCERSATAQSHACRRWG